MLNSFMRILGVVELVLLLDTGRTLKRTANQRTIELNRFLTFDFEKIFSETKPEVNWRHLEDIGDSQ